jgi:hypothetical protein
MAGKRTTPVVLLGRYTTFAGNNIFYTLPINVVAFDSFEIFFWRGDPGPQQEVTLTADITRPWLRATVEINGTAGTGYAYGHLFPRGS